MRFRESLLLTLASFVVLGGLGFVPYEINRRNNDNSIKFEGIVLGNPRTSFRFKGVSYQEAETLRGTMRDYSSRLANPGNLSAYYELIESSFNLNFEGIGVLESLNITNDLVKNSWLSLR
jgi:hypothetical protein